MFWRVFKQEFGNDGSDKYKKIRIKYYDIGKGISL